MGDPFIRNEGKIFLLIRGSTTGRAWIDNNVAVDGAARRGMSQSLSTPAISALSFETPRRPASRRPGEAERLGV